MMLHFSSIVFYALLVEAANSVPYSKSNEKQGQPNIPTLYDNIDESYHVVIPTDDERHLQSNNRVYNLDQRVGFQDPSGLLASGRYSLWDKVWPKLDSYKANTAVWDLSSSRPTFDKYHMFVLPIWWDGESQSNPFNETLIRAHLDLTAQYYKEMSWNKHRFTYEIWPQQIVLQGITNSSPTLDASRVATRAFVNSTGKIEFKDFSGISMFHNRALSGSLNSGGGWGSVNGKKVFHDE
jgi:hypothetical protein